MDIKGKGKLISTLGMIVTLMLMIFVISEFRTNYLAIGIIGIILLAVSYIYLNFERREAEEELQAERNEIRKQEDFWICQMRELQKSQKELYNAVKENTNTMKERSEEFVAWSELSAQRSFELQKKGIKAIIKYNRENAKQVAESITASLEQLKLQIDNELHTREEMNTVPDSNFTQTVLEHTQTVQEHLQKITKQIHQTQEILSKLSVQQTVKTFTPEQESLDLKDTEIEEVIESEDMIVSQPEEVIESEDIVVSQPEEVIESEDIVVSQPEEVIESENMIVSQPEEVIESEDIVIPQSEEVIESEDIVIPQSEEVIESEDIIVSQPEEVVENEYIMISGPEDLIGNEHIVVSQPEDQTDNEDIIFSELKDLVENEDMIFSELEEEDVQEEVAISLNSSPENLEEDSALIPRELPVQEEKKPVEVEPKPVVSQKSSDSNHMMTADEIAALIASMNS